ncbi:YihY/virulence factor BrkB family protein [Actinoplanes sp. DH11]|uniref:YihY/virulence factor BrkB family protein n=1 Tax=Actinoplanes sp. DH11 TaxID=2857011 RepID=UPI001E3F96FB|nr:YihY/virulence factor BrkB family protein [Actinoplanes sp. DH11]
MRTPTGKRPADDAEAVPGPPPQSPAHLPGRLWWATLRRTVKEFDDDGLADWAAALTYYAVLSVFPGLILLTSVLGLIGRPILEPLLDSLGQVAPGPVRDILTSSLVTIAQNQTKASVLAVVGLAGALWTASGYVGAFMRASNVIYDVPEGRPLWKTLPIRVAITVVVGAALAAGTLIVVFTGEVAEWVGRLLNVDRTALTVWSIAKWPVLLVLVGGILDLLFWAAPNARQAGFRWITPGGVLAVLLWIAASAGFGLYAAHFGSYDKTYGTLGGVAVFLVWLWLSNIAVLLGAELDAELHRSRAIAGGQPADQEPYMPLRDTKAL